MEEDQFKEPYKEPQKKGMSRNIQILIVCILVILVVIGVTKKITDAQAHNRQVQAAAVPLTGMGMDIEHTGSSTDIDPNIVLADATSSNPAQKPATAPAQPAAPKPLVTAQEYYVANLQTGEVYNDYNSKVIHPIASLSKLITALVALHTRQMNQEVTIDQSMLDAYGTAGELVLGDKLTLSELFNPLFLESSNDAAEAIAQSDPGGYSAFIAKMNSFAAELGMHSTSFQDASGLSPENVSNAQDLFVLAQYLYNSEPALLALTKTTQVTLASTTDHGAYTWNTINPFPLDPHFIGGKTGRTDEARETMISLFNYTYASTTYPIAVIVLRSDDGEREIDTSELFEQAISKISR